MQCEEFICLVTSFFYACYYALPSICQTTSLSVWPIGYQPFTLVASFSNFKVCSECCVKNILVWNEDDDSLTDSTQGILGIAVSGIE